MKNALTLCISLQNYTKPVLKLTDRKSIRKAKRYFNIKISNQFIISRMIISRFKKRSKFCISHKDGCVGVLFGKGKFGLDIEEIKQRNFSSICEFCFTEDELNIYKKSENTNTFYQIYTVKEAILKAENLGFSELRLINSLNYKSYICKSFLISNKYIISIVFKGKKDIILKFI
ncbi:4'-phosphopantetheinyl transferase family protein [Campylobacter sp. RM16187]|uniref:4'-phosphopantetheinyl transferase family protein n=1 Tax=Campylobacter sp. RM16187 TaxID=1660063 RepID=UPI0021B528F0|nr:4'-phosphopantetheinyl transferase superfamily protein [Campylobacter sp. RM16187]QKG29146.1 phosphopantetheinyl transferase family protein [Campylobacter sp. RM16187]